LCARSRSLAGVVRYKGQPVTGGELRLIDVNDFNKSQSARIDGDGKFEVLNAPVGEVKAVIDTEAAKTDLSVMAAKSGGAIDPSAYGKPVKYMAIDKKYADPQQTPVRLTIQKGSQTKDIELD
jgi:hypothetical protein